MAYIHEHSRSIDAFIQHTVTDMRDLPTICRQLLAWFDANVGYSRLNAPFFPLQRSDEDVLAMRCGTCGDYSNLLVSVLQKLGYEAGYAYVHKDCYGDEQDHICAAVRENDGWILVDATPPYRRWHGFGCPHREYELLTPGEFEERMKKEERYWTDAAHRYWDERLAGLFYAPWIHEEFLGKTEDAEENVFFLLLVDKEKTAALYAYLQVYTKEKGAMPVMSVLTKGTQTYCFSCKTPNGIWDNNQWSREYTEDEIPDDQKTADFFKLKKCIANVLPDIRSILQEVQLSL